MTMGPVAAVQQGSPAQRAVINVGDRIEGLNGEPIDNPLTLPQQLRRLAGQTVTLDVVREGAETAESISVELREPNMMQMGAGLGKPVAAESLGAAFYIESTIQDVAQDSPAQQAGLLPGDVIERVEFIPASPEDAATESKLFGPAEPIDLKEESRGWPFVQERMQLSLPSTKVKVTVDRSGSPQTFEVAMDSMDGWNVSDRGLILMKDKEVHRVQDWGEAWSLGLRETTESIQQVYFILFRLVTGQMSPTNLGGPASIATMAGMEASESTARLLIFLTLLSANLAVINFLPIPVLDGGHAMFLLYEGIFRRPVNERVAFGLTMVGFCFIVGLMLFVIGLDVWRLAGLAG